MEIQCIECGRIQQKKILMRMLQGMGNFNEFTPSNKRAKKLNKSSAIWYMLIHSQALSLARSLVGRDVK